MSVLRLHTTPVFPKHKDKTFTTPPKIADVSFISFWYNSSGLYFYHFILPKQFDYLNQCAGSIFIFPLIYFALY